ARPGGERAHGRKHRQRRRPSQGLARKAVLTVESNGVWCARRSVQAQASDHDRDRRKERAHGVAQQLSLVALRAFWRAALERTNQKVCITEACKAQVVR